MEWILAGWILINILVAAVLPITSVKPKEAAWKA